MLMDITWSQILNPCTPYPAYISIPFKFNNILFIDVSIRTYGIHSNWSVGHAVILKQLMSSLTGIKFRLISHGCRFLLMSKHSSCTLLWRDFNMIWHLIPSKHVIHIYFECLFPVPINFVQRKYYCFDCKHSI